MIHQEAVRPARPGFLRRWWIYQGERFPVFGHGLLIAAFSSSAVCYSALVRGEGEFPAAWVSLGAFLSSFLFFLELRIADEFKDAAEDALHRPYRPVPRGLVTFAELGWLAVLCGLMQAVLAGWLLPRLLPLLAFVWLWLGFMSREFFLGEWLKRRPAHYLWSHMLILPIIDCYVAAWDWLAYSYLPPGGLYWLLALSFANGVVVEIGRKLRAPVDEEPGVETYSALWGGRRAVAAWLAAMALAGGFALAAAARVGFLLEVAVLAALLYGAAAAVARGFLRSPGTGAGRKIERMAGLWTFAIYLAVGLAPMAWRAAGL